MNNFSQPISEPLPPESHRAACCVAASLGIIAGVALTLAVETWALFDLGFIRLRDPLAGEKAVAAAYWNEVYTRAEVCPIDEMNGEGP